MCFWNGECNINFHGFYHYSYNFQRNFPSNLSYLPSWKSSRQVTSPGSWVLVPKVLCCHRVVLTQSSLHLAPTSLDMDDSENLESYGWNKESNQDNFEISKDQQGAMLLLRTLGYSWLVKHINFQYDEPRRGRRKEERTPPRHPGFQAQQIRYRKTHPSKDV